MVCGHPAAQMSQSFESSRAPEPVGAFPHAKRVGNLLFLSGIGPRVRGSKDIPGVALDSAGKTTFCSRVFLSLSCLISFRYRSRAVSFMNESTGA